MLSRWSKRTHEATLAQVILVVLLTAGLALAQAAAGTTDPAYAAGYRAAYPLGQQDQAQGVPANAHKYQLYQQANSGYTDTYGSPESYRTAYQSGFEDGYADGYAGRTASISLTPATTEPASASAAPAPTPDPSAQTAIAYGYREGYNVGQADADRNAPDDPSASQEYKDASVGYRPDLGDTSQYQLNFRSGFTTGYSDGYNHRLYNSAVGARQLTLSPPTQAAANDLPTNPERAAARPSGVYANGLLVAEGTRIQATMDNTIDTQSARVGDRFSATVSVPVWVGSVQAIPAGSTIQGTVMQVQRGGKFKGSAQIQLQYDTLTLPGQAPIPLTATTAGVGQNAAKVNGQEGTVNGQSPHAAKKVATGAIIGAVLGGIFGGGGGMLRGAAAGGAVGTAGVLLSHTQDLVLHTGEAIGLQLDRPLEVPRTAAN